MNRGYPQTLSLSCKSSLFDYSASSSKVKVSAPSIAVLAPPSSLQRWGIPRFLSWFTDSQSLGPILLYLMHLDSFGFVWWCSRWEYITIFLPKVFEMKVTQYFDVNLSMKFSLFCVFLNRPFALDDHVINFVKTRGQFAFEFHESLKISKFTRIPMENHLGVTRWQKFSYKSF